MVFFGRDGGEKSSPKLLLKIRYTFEDTGNECFDLSPIQMSYVRVVNVKQPVETHVNTEWHIDQVFVLLLQAIIHRCQAIDDIRDGQQVIVVGELVLLKGVLGHVEVQQVHCGGKGGVAESSRWEWKGCERTQ